jgi:retron-type reverse transcriptase
MHQINVGSLSRCFDRLDGKKAVGIDRVNKTMYGENLTANLEDLIARMKRMAYRPGPVREVQIPKEGRRGATRTLGISNFEDKLVQKLDFGLF